MISIKNIAVGIAMLLAWVLTFWPVVAAHGQTPTRVSDSQVAAPPTQFTAIVVVTPTGKVLVQPEATIQIDLFAMPPVIRAVCPVPPVAPRETVDQYVVPVGGQTTFTLTATPASGTLAKVFRNGVLQWQGADYSLTGQVVLFLPGQGTAAGDLIQIWYWK